MENELKLIIKEYIKNVDSVCSNLLKGLDLNTKDDFWEYKKTESKMKYEVNGIKYIFHGRGCIATNSKLFID
ncbi:MAG: hypothetical protein LBR35_01730, partial [Rickettsiales bacterium]|nr:hypothetical protein [Rickettsiales bacterium]